MSYAFDIPRAVEMTTGALLRELGDEVDIIFRYGSLVRGDTNRFSDLDIAYTPGNESTRASITVLIDSIMVDLFALRWPRLAEMARFEDVFNTILRDCEIFYARNDEVRHRFQALKDELRANQQPASRPAMQRTAREIFERSGYKYYLLRQEAARDRRLAARQQAQAVLASMLHVLAVVNQTPLDTRRREQVLALPIQPPGLAESIERIMSPADMSELVEAVEGLMAKTRALLLAEQAALRQPRPLSEVLHSAYPELKGDIQHLILACERRDSYNFNLVSLLHELQIHMAWALEGVDYSEFNTAAEYEQDLEALGFPELLPYWEARDYDGLAEQCRRFDRRLREYLVENGVSLNDFADPDELQVYLDARGA